MRRPVCLYIFFVCRYVFLQVCLPTVLATTVHSVSIFPTLVMLEPLVCAGCASNKRLPKVLESLQFQTAEAVRFILCDLLHPSFLSCRDFPGTKEQCMDDSNFRYSQSQTDVRLNK